ncbi:YeeE/YedE family protein [Krasilnikovia sp. MM14-A1004]|uniref:YeeE/YedE family protein n=1 Tax=Krasilnikovia sp. MM14-A1004 TaxID=3373541 RepID=UPI00399C9E85
MHLPTIEVLDSGVRVRQATRITAPVSCAPPPVDPQAPVRRAALSTALLLTVAGTAAVTYAYGPRSGGLLATGLALGFALFHSRFGFTSGWQQLVAVGNGQGLRAQLVLFATAATAVMAVAAARFAVFDPAPQPQAARIGVTLVAGSALFGFGMQLGGSCASGTLYAVGAGQSSIVLTLAGFLAGSLVCTRASPLLSALPSVPGVLLADEVGWGGAWLITMAALLLIAATSWWIQRRRVPPPVAPTPTAHGPLRLLRGAWPMTAGAVVLGVLAGLLFLMTGRRWSVANGYALWAAKLGEHAGLQPHTWPFWQRPENAHALSGPLLTDQSSLTNFGIMAGAAVAALAAGAWQLHSSIAWRTAAAATLGGVLMGFGARMSGGCNIGALLGGISLGDLSGWIWGCGALAGTWLGIKARPAFGLHTPRPDSSVC